MNRFLERLKRPRSEDLSLNIGEIPPAEGDRQKQLEAACEELITRQPFSPLDAIEFNRHMISLLGGKAEDLKYGQTSLKSNPLTDTTNGLTVTFERFLRPDGHQESLTIKVQSDSGVGERLRGWLKNMDDLPKRRGNEPLEIWYDVPVDTSLTFPSIVTGKTMPIFKEPFIHPNRKVDADTEAKPFCARMLDVYKRSKK